MTIAISGLDTIQKTGADSNRIDIVFLGDGYTASDIGTTYVRDVEALTSYLFTAGSLSEPFDRYKRFFNVYAINVISNQSGADDKSTNTFVDTALIPHTSSTASPNASFRSMSRLVRRRSNKGWQVRASTPT